MRSYLKFRNLASNALATSSKGDIKLEFPPFSWIKIFLAFLRIRVMDDIRPIRGQYPGHVITLSQSEAGPCQGWGRGRRGRRGGSHSHPRHSGLAIHRLKCVSGEAAKDTETGGRRDEKGETRRLRVCEGRYPPGSEIINHSLSIRGQYPGHVITLSQ